MCVREKWDILSGVMTKDVVVIGGGAAGLMCAAEAGKRGRSVLVLEHSEKTGKKIRVSGGGRCNFTNLDVHAGHYLSGNPHFCKSALARFTPGDFISLLEKRSVRYHEKEAGQLFCEKSSSAVTDMLEKECEETGVEIRLRSRIKGIRKGGRFLISTDRGEVESESLVVATGGLSYPGLGASDLGYRIARQFGLQVTPLEPGLVPLTFQPGDARDFRELSGVSVDAVTGCGRKEFQGGVLFTHRGLSGPGILQISSYWKKGEAIWIDLFPGRDARGILEAKRQSRMELHNLLSAYLPRRFVHKWCERYSPSRPMVSYGEKELRMIAHQLNHWEILPQGREGYGKAEVTKGGVDTEELSSRTMEAKKVPGLFFVGEVVDVTGELGGYNLHWAWASGHAAGQYA